MNKQETLQEALIAAEQQRKIELINAGVPRSQVEAATLNTWTDQAFALLDQGVDLNTPVFSADETPSTT